MRTFPEARPILPIDLPLVRRLAAHGVSLDSATNLTRGPHTLEGALWSSVPLADFGTPTFVLRDSETAYVAQFRHRNGDSQAHITFIAPDVSLCGDSGWLSLIDSMTQAAGRRGATMLKAEVCETGLKAVRRHVATLWFCLRCVQGKPCRSGLLSPLARPKEMSCASI